MLFLMLEVMYFGLACDWDEIPTLLFAPLLLLFKMYPCPLADIAEVEEATPTFLAFNVSVWEGLVR